MRLLALHCNPQLVFCGGHFLMLPLHNNGTKIGIDSDQSCASQLPRVEGFLGCGLALTPQTRPAKLCLCGPKQTLRPQPVISVTAIKERRQLTFLLSMAIGFLVPSKVHRILFPWTYTLSRPAKLYAHLSRESLWTNDPRAAGWLAGTAVLHAAGIHTKRDSSL